MNFLFCSVGRRGRLIKDIKLSLDRDSKIIATDCDNTAPALYYADKQYILPKVTDRHYIDKLLNICQMEHVDAVTTFIDPEIKILTDNRDKFKAIGVVVLAPYSETADICFDKYEMYKYLTQKKIKTIKAFNSIESFNTDFVTGSVEFPVFIKPRTGSGSEGARKINSYDELIECWAKNEDLIIQEFMDCNDLDADVYVDTISQKAVSIFTKKKFETKIGGANKTVSYKDSKLFDIIEEVVSHFHFYGPIDIDFFHKDGDYYLSEINPRFGGAYIHAHACGVDFIKLILNNLNNIENKPVFGNYEEDILMMMYDNVIIRKLDELPVNI